MRPAPPARAPAWKTHLDAAEAAREEGDYDKAQQHARLAVSEAEKLGPGGPELGECLIEFGMAETELQHYAEAAEALSKALSIFERDRDKGRELFILQYLGSVNVAAGKYAEAAACLTKAIALDHEDAALYYWRGEANFGARNCARAIADFDQATSMQPDYADAWNSLAWLLATCGDANCRDGPRAVAAANRALQAADEKTPAYLDTLAAAHAEAGQFEDAVRVQKEAIGLLKDAEEIKDCTARLKLYEQRKPYREH